jgi:2-polyprenyl-3-methyl-5-hydroxy-6-metoxy-1,4-benzoquinol methylase
MESMPSLIDQQRFWNEWNATLRDPKNLNEWSIRRGKAIVDLVNGLVDGRPKILDFGCGTGWLAERLAEFGDVTGVDLAERVILDAQARAPHIKFLAGDFFQLPLPRAHYDIVVSQEVVAHVPNQAAYIDRAAELLKPGGYFVITTPNKFVMQRGDWPIQPPEHIEQWLSMGELKALLKPRFKILRTSTITPIGNRGVLRVINSPRLNSAVALVSSRERLAKLKERAGYGYNLIAAAQKK